eukprot:14609016-Alexandrium_andersonii.AAC.1
MEGRDRPSHPMRLRPQLGHIQLAHPGAPRLRNWSAAARQEPPSWNEQRMLRPLRSRKHSGEGCPRAATRQETGAATAL